MKRLSFMSLPPLLLNAPLISSQILHASGNSARISREVERIAEIVRALTEPVRQDPQAMQFSEIIVVFGRRGEDKCFPEGRLSF
jgi:hypothetical protein